ncbi:helix-turn-helix domain-containing protein [Pseudomonas sp. NPDC087029]|uniref:helix-turn-helix domain-containing protein n=1 Tax=Pseudomonas sp. NPDC087029 TaxID=3364433 RepID=UPI00382C3572
MDCPSTLAPTPHAATQTALIPSLPSAPAGMPAPGFSHWRMSASVLFEVSTRAPDAFSCSLTVYHFSRFLFCCGHLDGARYQRDRTRLGWCDLDHYLLHLPLQRGLACGNGMRVRPRDLVMLDLAQPSRFGMASSEGMSLLIPRTALSLLLFDAGQLHGLVLRRETAAGMLLAHLFSSLAASAPCLGTDEALRLALPLLGMVAACLAKATQAIAPGAGPVDLGRRVRLLIERNLHRSDLTPALLAKEAGTSRSQLYRAFERFGGVRHYVLQRRLRHCLFALCDSANAGRRIGDLAFEHGFVDEAHFSRLFRKAFGLSPRAARTALHAGAVPGFFSLVPLPGERSALDQWVRELTYS